MRLIDLDKLLLQVKMRRYTKASLSLLYNQEVVDAIPTNWMKNYAKNKASKDSMDGYWHIFEEDILKMIADWRKENETN